VTLYRRLLQSRADMVQGTRSSIERLRDSRMVFSRALNLLLNIAFRTWATDSKSGFVLAPHRVLEDVLSYRGRYRYFQTFISVAAKSKGYEVLEVETLFQSRYAGTSFLSGKAWWVSLGALADFPRALIEFGWPKRAPYQASIAPKAYPLPRARHPYHGRRRLRFEAYFATTPLHKWKIMLRITTSGSTGEPFTTYGDRYQLEMRFATTLRALEWTGWRFGDRQARLWHQTLGMSRSQVIREKTDAWFMRRLFIPAFEITPG